MKSSPRINNVQIPGIMYADDICLMYTQTGLQKKLSSLEEYCKHWDLNINIKKTKIIIGNKGNCIKRSEKWFLHNQQIDLSCHADEKSSYEYGSDFQ